MNRATNIDIVAFRSAQNIIYGFPSLQNIFFGSSKKLDWVLMGRTRSFYSKFVYGQGGCNERKWISDTHSMIYSFFLNG